MTGDDEVEQSNAGIYAFFQPLLFRVPLRQMIAASQAAAIGPQALRTGLSLAAVGLLWLSLGMRLAGYWFTPPE